MRVIALFLIAVLAYSDEFPVIFSSVGNPVFENMKRYEKIKNLDIYKDRPELLEAYCYDANKTMQRGFALDKMKDDPEVIVEKAIIKSYAKELRALAKKNEAIMQQLDRDVRVLSEAHDYKTLQQIDDAGFLLSPEIMQSISNYEKEEALQKAIDKVNSDPIKLKDASSVALQKVNSEAVPSPAIKASENEAKAVPSLEDEAVEKRVEKPETEGTEEADDTQTEETMNEQEYYQKSLARLKDELYMLRESGDQSMMACLNDITATNYWMIKVLQNKEDACALRDAIKQMKSYSKASAESCGRDSMRYIEWRGRIKPYVGQQLFEAEANCLD